MLVEWPEKHLQVCGWVELASGLGFWVGCSLAQAQELIRVKVLRWVQFQLGQGWLAQKSLAWVSLVPGLADGDTTN